MERENEARNTCFVCGIERHDYDRIVNPGEGLSFLQHRDQEHSTVNYIFFILNIWNQSPAEDSSLEIFVRNCLSKKDVSWFPTGIQQELHKGEHSEHHSLHDNSHSGGKTGGLSPRDGGGGGGSHKRPSTGGNGKRHRHDSHPKTVTLLSPDHDKHGHGTPNNENHLEVLDKMANLQKQLNKLTKALSNENTAMVYPASHRPSLVQANPESPSSSAAHSPVHHVRKSFGNRNGAESFDETSGPSSLIMAVDGAAAVSSVAQKAEADREERFVKTMSTLDDRLVLVIDRLDKLERKFLKSHKYLRSKIEDQKSSSSNLGNAYASTFSNLDEGNENTDLDDKELSDYPGSEPPAGPPIGTLQQRKATSSQSKSKSAKSNNKLISHLKSTSTIDAQSAPIQIVPSSSISGAVSQVSAEGVKENEVLLGAQEKSCMVQAFNDVSTRTDMPDMTIVSIEHDEKLTDVAPSEL
ncbi:hypothetical protein EON65_22455 [archaeon]|nr:MAG: hypothetical protein EON65_22455 [archaeon]